MKIGDQLTLGNSLTDENMVFLKQLGVSHLTVRFLEMKLNEPKEGHSLWRLRDGTYYEIGDLIELRKWVESHGLELSVSVMPSSNWEKVVLGQAGRDEQIENINRSLRNMAKAGISELHYNWVLNIGAWMPMWRTSMENVGRSGTRIVRFNYDIARRVPLTKYGEVSEETMWESLTHFLKSVIPVAEKAGVMIHMHPADPQVPNLAGIPRIVRSVEVYDRMFDIMPSRANSMTFCLGCFSQMMDAGGVYEAIRHFGKEGRIGRVHFRDVRGTLERFDEVFPDEGKLDMLQAVKVLKEVGFNRVIEIDHTPRPIGDTEYAHISHAFQIGYLKGILQGADALE